LENHVEFTIHPPSRGLASCRGSTTRVGNRQLVNHYGTLAGSRTSRSCARTRIGIVRFL
jgi:hypothetical protein